MKTSRRGFTLIELLVVIAIIALLVSILMPALNQARAQAKMAVCSVHLSGIGKATLMYINDNKDILPTEGIHRFGPSKDTAVMAILGINNQHSSIYYTYWLPGWSAAGATGAGPANLGCLYLTGQIENISDIVFCPGFHCNPCDGGYSGGRMDTHGKEYNAWNCRGNPRHFNYAGVNPDNAQLLTGTLSVTGHLTAADEAKIGWLNYRVSYSFRPMVDLGIKNIAQTKSSMSYIADVWLANNGPYHMHLDMLSHSAQGGTEAKIHAWYFDGHINRGSYAKDKYFKSGGSSGYIGFLNTDLTWAVLFEGAEYDFTKSQQ